MAAETWDIVVIGGGIAGASAAYELAAEARVALLEAESQPGYHTTGRSAALYTETYGNAVIRRLSTCAGPFLRDPPEGFADGPILTPRGALFLARADQIAALDAQEAELRALDARVERVAGDDLLRLNPAIRPEYAAAALHEPAAEDVDVHALHTGYLRGLTRRGGTVLASAPVRRLAREGGGWRVETPSATLSAGTVVNAAGAWADTVAGLAGLPPCGVVPKRRTAFTFDPPEGLDPAPWPATIDIDERFYFRPDAGRVLGSPADETPSPPCDARPEEIDVAIGIDRIETATRLSVRRLASKWAGLRSFAPDKTPVVGFDPGAEGFFWLAGQGGYGIQTAPALARATAALIVTGALPPDLAAAGLAPAALAPDRFR